MSENSSAGTENQVPPVPQTTVVEKSVTSASPKPNGSASSKARASATPSQQTQTVDLASGNERWAWLLALGVLVFPLALVSLYFLRFSAKEEMAFIGPEKLVTCVAVSPDGKRVAASSADGKIYIWNRASGELIKSFDPDAGTAYAVSFAPNSKTLLTSDGVSLRLYDIETMSLIKRIDPMRNYVIVAMYSPDGRYFVTSSRAEGLPGPNKGTVRIWDASTFKEIGSLSGYEYPVSSIAISQDGSKLIASDGKELSLWDVDSVKKLRTFDPEYTIGTNCVAFAPDGKSIAFAGDQPSEPGSDKAIYLLELDNGNVQKLEGHKSPILCLAFSPDGKRLVSGSLGMQKAKPGEKSSGLRDPRTIRVWSVDLGIECGQFDRATDPIWSVAFTPDSLSIVTGGSAHNGAVGKVQLWWLP